MAGNNVILYHNPRCSKSRSTLQLLEQKGVVPDVVEYLKTPPDTDTLRDLLHKLGMRPRDLLRQGEEEYSRLGLADPGLSEEALIAIMVQHPRLIERPIVVANGKAVLGRPPEKVMDIL